MVSSPENSLMPKALSLSFSELEEPETYNFQPISRAPQKAMFLEKIDVTTLQKDLLEFQTKAWQRKSWRRKINVVKWYKICYKSSSNLLLKIHSWRSFYLWWLVIPSFIQSNGLLTPSVEVSHQRPKTMTMSNRSLKLKLFQENDRCYYCNCQLILTNIKNLPSGQSLPDNAATIEHLRSRYSVSRFVKKKKGERRKVLACYKCNHGRSILETLCLSRKEVLQRSKGYSLNPRGRPRIIKPLDTVREVKKALAAWLSENFC